MLFTSAMAQTAPAVAPGAPQAPGIVESFVIPMALMFVVFYFLLIRPQQNARKKHMAMINAIKKGDTVVTAGGFVAKVVKAADGPEVVVEIADGVQATVVRATITEVRGKGTATTTPDKSSGKGTGKASDKSTASADKNNAADDGAPSTPANQ